MATTSTTPTLRRSGRVAAAATNNNPTNASPPLPKKATGKRKGLVATTASTVTPPRRKVKRTGLRDTIDASAPLGVIDPESKIEDTAVIETIDSEPCDVMLALVDPAKHTDKFFVLQLIRKDCQVDKENDGNTNVDGNPSYWVVYTRWGRTGTSGQALLQEFDNFTDAATCFQDKFRQKSGLDWPDRNEPTVGGKYRFLTQDFTQKLGGYNGAMWQYWVDDGIDGKATGWYDYDRPASQQVERLYHEYMNNHQMLAQRSVQSGIYTYLVDLRQMIQTNTTHVNHTSRRIRRVPNGVDMGNEPPIPTQTTSGSLTATSGPVKVPSGPDPVVSEPEAVSSGPDAVPSEPDAVPSGPDAVPSGPDAVPSGPDAVSSGPDAVPSGPYAVPSGPDAVPSGPDPVASSSGPDPVTSGPDPVASMPTAAKSAGKKKASHPVDPDIVLHGRAPSTFEVVESSDGKWYDIVLNQCNISGNNNNNKYYRLQILKETSTGQFYAWFKWGRVGEPATTGASSWVGPFADHGAALVQFSKKYRDKTGNKFDVDEFVPKKGKYVPIEIDNDVQVKEEFEQSAVNIKNEEVEYLSSTLEPKTRELIEVLFSKEMRNEALTSFNLDLKRLPLGVPSKQQIQFGVSILGEIENKLNGGDSEETFDEISSRFYTAIPHSFGRSRPPVISTKESLQSRYDMCNILLDMYSTNETVRNIEKEVSQKKQVPYPADQHYQSLNAELTLVDKSTQEYKMIYEYFTKTKASHSRAQLLNIWSVDRHGEAARFRKYDKLGNRRLLWHGTNIAVVAPILTSGLRIMPHSGGRVGSGIYMAALQEKSAQYTSGYGSKFACMFLTEASLGKSFVVHSDGSHASSLKTAPEGYDSVHAVGTMQPKKWVPMLLDGKEVQVPQSEAEPSGLNSSFNHDEYLAYDEAQVRLRYVLTIRL